MHLADYWLVGPLRWEQYLLNTFKSYALFAYARSNTFKSHALFAYWICKSGICCFWALAPKVIVMWFLHGLCFISPYAHDSFPCPQDLVSCFEEKTDEADFLKHHAHHLLPSILSKQTSARVTVTQYSQSASLHDPKEQEEYLAAQQLLSNSTADMQQYAEGAGDCWSPKSAQHDRFKSGMLWTCIFFAYLFLLSEECLAKKCCPYSENITESFLQRLHILHAARGKSWHHVTCKSARLVQGPLKRHSW